MIGPSPQTTLLPLSPRRWGCYPGLNQAASGQGAITDGNGEENEKVINKADNLLVEVVIVVLLLDHGALSAPVAANLPSTARGGHT
jgi:hypothetical protein